MFTGNSIWNQEISAGLEKREFNGRVYDYYGDVPDNLFLALKRTAEKNAEKNGIYDNLEIKHTYEQYLHDVLVFANYLYTEQGIRRGNHLALMMYNSYEFCVAFFACIRLGAVVIPLPSKYHKDEVLSLCEKSDLHGVICDAHFTEWFDQLKENGRIIIEASSDSYGFAFAGNQELSNEVETATPDDRAVIMFTSGTTSKSKGVVIRHYNIMHAVAVYQRVLDLSEDDKTIIPVPIYHVTGLVALLGLFVYTGGTIYIHKFFDAKRVLETSVRRKITFLHASPTVFSLLLQEKNNFPEIPTLKKFGCGSSNMPKQKLCALHEWLPQMQFRTIYGLTETTSPGTVFPTDAATHPYIGSSGIPVPGLTVKVIGENGNELPCGYSGEILLYGTVVVDEYYKMETEFLKDGWLNTGDIGYVNEDGFLFIVDRKKDMINRGGEKICSYDVENELYKIDGILDAAVVGIPHEIYGEVAAAAVKKKEGSLLDEAAVKELLKPHLAKYKIPEKILFVDEIPLTPNSKIDKNSIRKLFL